MKFYCFVIFVQIIQGCSSASKIFLQDVNEHMETALSDIVSRCFGSSEGWSELLIVQTDQDSRGIIEKIHRESRTSNSIVFLDSGTKNNEPTASGEGNDYSNTGFEWGKSKTTAVMIATHSVKHLEYVLGSMKNSTNPRLWRPRSYFIIVLDTRCDIAECNKMLKVMWDYWILNAVIMSNNPAGNRNQSEIELYTFNPYSADHPQQWEIIIHETVEVSIAPGNFNHSWYILKQKFIDLAPSIDICGDLFFDKTLNLDGYVIPIIVDDPKIFRDTGKSILENAFASEYRILKTISKLRRFNVAQVIINVGDRYKSKRLENGSYTGTLKEVYERRSHLVPTYSKLENFLDGLEMIDSNHRSSFCLASRIIGNRPQWTNLAVAKHIWISLGLSLLFSTIVFYLQNRPHGVVSAILNAERLVIGTSVIRTSAAVKHRIILGSMLLVILVIDGSMRGRFISILSIVRPYPNLEIPAQLQGQDIDVFGPSIFGDLFSGLQQVRYHSNTTFGKCFDSLVREGRRIVCLSDCGYIMRFTWNTSIIHRASTPIVTIPVAFVTALNWPMKDRYSSDDLQLMESGIYPKWKSELARESEVDGWKENRVLDPPYVRATKLNDLLPALLLLFIGLSAALIVFLCEIIRS